MQKSCLLYTSFAYQPVLAPLDGHDAFPLHTLRIRDQQIRAGKLLQPAPCPADVPVSYTHLDVAAGRFSLAASLVPAREVGGDLYDFFMLDDRHLCFIIGDVSDKGVPASLFMSMTLTLIRSRAGSHPSPEHLMAEVNENLSLIHI